jgi:hypothetical protein
VTVEIEQVEGDQGDLLGTACKTEKSVMPFSAATTTSPSMIAEPALTCQASAAIFRKRLVQSLPRRVKTLTAAFPEMDLHPVAVEFDLVNPALA